MIKSGGFPAPFGLSAQVGSNQMCLNCSLSIFTLTPRHSMEFFLELPTHPLVWVNKRFHLWCLAAKGKGDMSCRLHTETQYEHMKQINSVGEPSRQTVPKMSCATAYCIRKYSMVLIMSDMSISTTVKIAFELPMDYYDRYYCLGTILTIQLHSRNYIAPCQHIVSHIPVQQSLY